MTVRAVLFDWGGTLTPYHQVDLLDLWRVAARMFAPGRVDEVAQALLDAETRWWQAAVASGRSGTTEEIVRAAAAATGIDVPAALHSEALAAHLDAWTPHTHTDPAAGPLLRALKGRGIRTGLLSNTHWPRQWHEHWLARDSVLDLLDARVYTSELAHVKPHPEAFQAVMAAVGVDDPTACVFVGDRPHDDVSEARRVGMRAVLLPNEFVPGYDVEPDARISSLGELLPLVERWAAD